MADYAHASIMIGGELKRSDVPEFLRILGYYGLCSQRTDEPYNPESETELLEEYAQDDKGRLDVYDSEVRWGFFESLENFCVEKGLWYQRSNGKDGFDIEEQLTFFKPGMGTPEMVATLDGEEVYTRDAVLKMLDEYRTVRSLQKRLKKEKGLLDTMPPLEVVDG